MGSSPSKVGIHLKPFHKTAAGIFRTPVALLHRRSTIRSLMLHGRRTGKKCDSAPRDLAPLSSPYRTAILGAALTTLDDCEGQPMAEPAPGLRTLPHAVFLERMAGAPSVSSSDARLGRAAFVALRLVDLLAHDREALHPGAFHYQHVATERACRDLPADKTETTHLVGVVGGAADAFQAQDARLVVPALLAYAHYLEAEMRLEEALDTLETSLNVGEQDLRPADRTDIRLRIARVLRKLNRFDAAERCYEAAGTLAAASNDPHSLLLSRIGHANSVMGRGKLGEAERLLREALVEAEALGDADVQARVRQGLAVTLTTLGQPLEAIPHIWRAVRLFEDDISRTRALADLGGLLLIVGEIASAERALGEAVRLGGEQDYATNALIELMNCASFRRDRLGFERWRERCEERRDTMPPNILVDFTLKTGIGLARFGQIDRSEALLGVALGMAERARLHEFVFRIERIKRGLRACTEPLEAAQQATAAPEWQQEAIREVSAQLADLTP
jgi:tetratricopeptide (TPR) repeat protein